MKVGESRDVRKDAGGSDVEAPGSFQDKAPLPKGRQRPGEVDATPEGKDLAAQLDFILSEQQAAQLDAALLYQRQQRGNEQGVDPSAATEHRDISLGETARLRKRRVSGTHSGTGSGSSSHQLDPQDERSPHRVVSDPDSSPKARRQRRTHPPVRLVGGVVIH